MTELEKIESAKAYVVKLANGINPIDDSPVADSDIVNNVRISRCLFYVSDILQQVIDNKGVVKRTVVKTLKESFSITQEQISLFHFSNEPITVSEIAKRINEVADLKENQSKLKPADINTALVEMGALEIVTSYNGKTRKLPTKMGESIGIIAQERTGQYGVYINVLFSKAAQQFIVDNIDAIVNIYNSSLEKKKSESAKENEQAQSTWEQDELARLVDLFGDGVSTKEIAKQLNKTESQVKSELIKFGFQNYI